MLDRAIITSASNKYFPSLINLLTSIKVNYPNHPIIFVYDLGLLSIFRKEIELVENVKVITMPKFCNHWRSCYTWKTYIFAHPIAKLNFYLDAGCQVLEPIDDIFNIINQDDIYLISQGITFDKIVPNSYKKLFDIEYKFDHKTALHAGIIGYKNSDIINEIFNKIYNSAIIGLNLGFSANDSWRNKGMDRNIFIRDCDLFRHDLTMLNIYFRKYLDAKIIEHPVFQFDAVRHIKSVKQKIWQLRLSYNNLENLSINKLHYRYNNIYLINRIIIYIIILTKNIKNKLKKI